MASIEFRIEETTREGYIAWDAIESISGDRFPVNASVPYKAGTFPEITDYLMDRGIDFQVSYLDSGSDSLNDTTWEYVRGNHRVIVRDIPRAIFRIRVG